MDRILEAYKLIRAEAVDRLDKNGDYAGKLCEVCYEIDAFILTEMKQLREAERYGKQ